jgi:hypothetical protein
MFCAGMFLSFHLLMEKRGGRIVEESESKQAGDKPRYRILY